MPQYKVIKAHTTQAKLLQKIPRDGFDSNFKPPSLQINPHLMTKNHPTKVFLNKVKHNLGKRQKGINKYHRYFPVQKRLITEGRQHWMAAPQLPHCKISGYQRAFSHHHG